MLKNIKLVQFGFFLLISITCFAQGTMIPADNATNISADMQFKLTFSVAPVLQNTGTIKLYKSDGTLVETIDLSLIPSGTPMSATWPWTEQLNSSTIRVFRVVIDKNTAYISFSIGAMTYDTEYYITVDESIFSNSSTLGFTGIAANEWSFTTRSKPATDLDYTVADDGTGDFATLQGALDFIPSGNNSDAKIFVKNGTYIGLAFSKNRNKITIEGENVDSVFVKAYNNSNLNASTHWRSVVNLDGDDLTLLSITFINTTPKGGTQAESVKLNGDRCIIANCYFYSYQDTVLIEGTVYFIDCMLEGDVDFVWGRGTVFFQSCEIRANNDGYNVMARNDNTRHGYAFADCYISRANTSTTSHYLARDAGDSYPYAEVVYLNCSLTDHIADKGWNINSAIDASNIFFAEYQSVDIFGNLIDVSKRDSRSKQLTETENNQYRDLNWFFNGWTPVVPEYTSVKKPVVVITSPSKNITWPYNDTLTIEAFASDPDGEINSVEFFNNDTLIGTSTTAPYSIEWSDIPVGANYITAVATDTSGLKSTSFSIKVTAIIPVSGINVTPDTLTVYIDEIVNMTIDIVPVDASNQNVKLVSSSSTIAYVNSTSKTVKGKSAGFATVTVTSRDGSNIVDSCVVRVIDPASIDILQESSSVDIHVYPNPVTDFLNIEFNSLLSKPVNISLFDASGKEVMTMQFNSSKNSFDVSGLTSGVYMIHVSEFDIVKQVMIMNE